MRNICKLKAKSEPLFINLSSFLQIQTTHLGYEDKSFAFEPCVSHSDFRK